VQATLFGEPLRLISVQARKLLRAFEQLPLPSVAFRLRKRGIGQLVNLLRGELGRSRSRPRSTALQRTRMFQANFDQPTKRVGPGFGPVMGCHRSTSAVKAASPSLLLSSFRFRLPHDLGLPRGRSRRKCQLPAAYGVTSSGDWPLLPRKKHAQAPIERQTFAPIQAASSA
jgi:hypothetical protein